VTDGLGSHDSARPCAPLFPLHFCRQRPSLLAQPSPFYGFNCGPSAALGVLLLHIIFHAPSDALPGPSAHLVLILYVERAASPVNQRKLRFCCVQLRFFD